MSYTLYNSADVEKLLRDLQPLQESIEAASEAFLQLGESGFQLKLVEDWITKFQYYSSPEHHVKRLSLFYLANDIVQKCRTRVPGYIEGFRGALCQALRLVVDRGDEQNIQPISNLVELWKNRRVFPKDGIKEMQEILAEFTTVLSRKEDKDKSESEIPEGLIRVPQELISFTEASRDLEKWKTKTMEAEGKLKMVLKDDHFNEDEANLHLSEYKRCLELEQKYRTNSLKTQMELMRQLDTDHMKYTHMLKKVGNLLDEIDNL